MARARIELEEMRDFTGGLNLANDPYNLAENETFDLQDVDLDRRGGFGIRRGVRKFIDKRINRIVTAAAASRTTNVVTATGLFPLNGDPDGLIPGMQITVNFEDNTYDGTFTVVTAAGGGSTATWAQVAADDVGAGVGSILENQLLPDSGYTYEDPSAVRHLLVARGGLVKRWSGTAWIAVIDDIIGGSGRAQFIEYKDVLYILPHPGLVPRTWAGTGEATPLTTVVGNYNDDLTAPNNGNFPQCDAIAVHKEVAWAGAVVEAVGGTNKSRVRWSHPGNSQDWRNNDFIDLDPDDENGRIRALVPFGDRLLVFKDRAIYAIAGEPPAAFSVENLTKKVGTPSAYSVTATEQEVYFWDSDTGLWKYDGRSFEWVFEPIYRMLDDSKINPQFSFQTVITWFRDRVWCSVPMLAPPYNGRFVNLVYQTNTGKKGAWTLHTATLFGFQQHRASTSGSDTHLLGGRFNGAGANFLYELDVENVYDDSIEYGVVAAILNENGTNSSNVQTPDAAAHDLTNDIDVRISAYRENWQLTAGDGEILASKWQATVSESWILLLNQGGFIELGWTPNGSTDTFLAPSTVPLPFTNAQLELRFTMDVNDGAGNKVLTYYYREAGATEWIQLGEALTQAGTTTIFNGSAPIVMGAGLEADADAHGIFVNYHPFTGAITAFALLNGISGPAIVNASFTQALLMSPTFTDATGLVWQPRRGAFFGFFTQIHQPIKAWYTTRWFDANTPAMKKRWKRPIVVTRGGSNQQTRVEVLQDYDPTHVRKTFDLFTSIPSETVVRSYLELNATGDYVETADSGFDLVPTRTLVIGVEIDPVDASSGVAQTLLSKWDGIIGNERSFMFQLSATGFPRIITTPDGTAGAQIITTSTAALPDDNRRCVWVEFDPDNGANRVTRFFTSATIDGALTQLGATVTGAVTSVFDSSTAVQIGAFENVGEPYTGLIYAATTRHTSIDGVPTSNPNFTAQVPGSTAFDDDFFHTWQLFGTATIVDDSVIVSDEGVWDVNSWDEMFWARELTIAGERSVILRGPPLGGGVARSLRFKNTTLSQDWRIHGLTMKWIPKRIRN